MHTDRLPNLTQHEVVALTRAATWYANYFSGEIAAESGEDHAYAVEERRDYLALVDALRKLGVSFALPDALVDHARSAA